MYSVNFLAAVISTLYFLGEKGLFEFLGQMSELMLGNHHFVRTLKGFFVLVDFLKESFVPGLKFQDVIYFLLNSLSQGLEELVFLKRSEYLGDSAVPLGQEL